MSKRLVQKEVDNCTKWLAAEHSYLKDLREDIQRLKADCEIALIQEERKDIKRAFSDFRMLAKSARRSYYSSKEMDEELSKLIHRATEKSKFQKTYLTFKEKNFPQHINVEERWHFLNNFMKELNILHQKNIYFSSRFEGVLHQDLESIENLIKKNKDPQIKIQDLLAKLNEFEQWLAAIVVDSKKAGQIGLELAQEYLPDFALKIKAAQSLPKVDYTHTFGKYKIRILIRFRGGYNPKESAELLGLFQHAAINLVDPAQQSLGHENIPESFEFLKKRIRGKQFLNVKKFHNYAFDTLLKTIIQLAEKNPELMPCPNMTFVATIYGRETTTWTRATAFCPGAENVGYNLKEIYIGSLKLLSESFFSRNFFEPIDPAIARQLITLSGDEPFSQHVLAITNETSRAIVYDNYSSSLSRVLLHEFTHATDYHANLKAVNRTMNDIFPTIVQKVYGNNLIVPTDYLYYLGELFTSCSVEALAMLAERFVKNQQEKYQQGSFIHTAPLKESTKNIIVNFATLMNSLTQHAGQQLDLFGQKEAHQAKIEPYDLAYICNIVILIDYIFRTNIPTFIVSKEDFESIAIKNFPISYAYLQGKKERPPAPGSLREGSLDERMYSACTKQDMLRIKQLIVQAGGKIVDTQHLFRKYYEKNYGFYIYKMDKQYALQLLNIMRLNRVNFYEMYRDACSRLGIDCAFDERRMGDLFYRSVQEYNKIFNRKMLQKIT